MLLSSRGNHAKYATRVILLNCQCHVKVISLPVNTLSCDRSKTAFPLEAKLCVIMMTTQKKELKH